jgi:hypothetical protein
MTSKETLSQREKRDLDRQLDKELEDTFPASDPPKITRSAAKSPSVTDRTGKSAAPRKVRAKRLSIL